MRIVWLLTVHNPKRFVPIRADLQTGAQTFLAYRAPPPQRHPTGSSGSNRDRASPSPYASSRAGRRPSGRPGRQQQVLAGLPQPAQRHRRGCADYESRPQQRCCGERSDFQVRYFSRPRLFQPRRSNNALSVGSSPCAACGRRSHSRNILICYVRCESSRCATHQCVYDTCPILDAEKNPDVR